MASSSGEPRPARTRKQRRHSRFMRGSVLVTGETHDT